MKMTPDEILARIMPQWDEFCKTKEWKTFIVNKGPDCDYCQLWQDEAFDGCGNLEACEFPKIDGKRIGFISDDGGFLMAKLRELFPEIGITEEDFRKRYVYCEEYDLFDTEYDTFFKDDRFEKNVVFPVEQDAKNDADCLVSDIIETVFDPDLKIAEDEESLETPQ